MYLVTGASSGIGQAIATELLQRGCKVALVARSIHKHQQLKEAYNNALLITADVSTPEGRATIATSINNDLISGVIHAAGSHIATNHYLEISPETLTNDFDVHVSAPLAINKLLATQLVGGCIVYIDSYSASTHREGWSGYSIVKAAAQMAAKAAAVELKDSNVIRVFPGGVRTSLVEAVINSSDDSPTTRAFRALQTTGSMVEPQAIGTYVANILLNTNEQQLSEREYWDFGKPTDHLNW